MILSITNAEYRKKFERKKEKQQERRKNEKRKRHKVIDMSYAMRKRVFVFQNENNNFAFQCSQITLLQQRPFMCHMADPLETHEYATMEIDILNGH